VWQLITRDQVGLGWRAPLSASIFTHLDAIDVVEVIADDYFNASARVLRSLRSLAREVPMAVHGVALGLASVVRSTWRSSGAGLMRSATSPHLRETP